MPNTTQWNRELLALFTDTEAKFTCGCPITPENTYERRSVVGPKMCRAHAIKRHFKYEYGITIEDREAMRVAQNNTCPICLEPFTEANPPHVDHNKETGKVRKLLHSLCNRNIVSVVEDHPDDVERAKRYLREHAETDQPSCRALARIAGPVKEEATT